MPAPIPVELRQRVVDAYENGEGTYDDMAERFKVGLASVSRWLGQFRRTGTVEPKPTGGDRRSVLPQEARDCIESLVQDEPNWTTTELAEELEESLGITVSRQVVGLALNKMGFTFKRGSSGRQLLRNPRSSPEEKPTSTGSRRWM